MKIHFPHSSVGNLTRIVIFDTSHDKLSKNNVLIFRSRLQISKLDKQSLLSLDCITRSEIPENQNQWQGGSGGQVLTWGQ